MKFLNVKLDNKTVKVEKLPLKKYVELLKRLKTLPSFLGEFQSLSAEELTTKLPTILETSLPEIVGLISLATELPEDEIEELGLAEITDLIVAVIEVNRYGDILDRLKKVQVQPVQSKN